MTINLRHIGIVVHNLDENIYFWTNIMGFKIEKQMKEIGENIDKITGLKNVKLTTIKLSDKQSNLIELLKFHSHPDKKQWPGKPYSTGITHIAFTVKDINSMIKQLNRRGYMNNLEPQISTDGKVKVLYAKGPEGLILELVEILNE